MRSLSMLLFRCLPAYILLVGLISFLFTTTAHSQWVQTNGPNGGDVNSLAVSGTNLFAGIWGGGVFLSTNDGINWRAANTGLTDTRVTSLAVSGTHLFAGTGGGVVFLSTNNGTSWTAASNGLTNTTVRSLAVSGTHLFAGTGGGGVFLSNNNGTSWTAANTGLTDTYVEALAVSGTNLFAGTSDGVFLSTNNGTSWTAAGLTNTNIQDLAVSGTNLFAGTYGGVFRSTNNGIYWTAVSTGLTNTIVRSLAVSGTNLFAGTEDSGVFLSTNNGTSWTAASTGLTTTDVRSLAVSGTNLFAGTMGGGVFLSTNNGTSWTAASTGLTTSWVWSLAVSGTNLFAGTLNRGVFLSTNNGTSWTAANTGLTNTGVMSLAVSGTNLFAGTAGDGVWRRPLSEMITSVSVSQGVSITPSPVIHANNFTSTFTLKETQGSPITFETIVCEILNSSNNHVVDMERQNNVTIPANGTYQYSSTQQWRLTDPTGNYRAVARGKIAGGNRFDFTVTDSGVNGVRFTVNPESLTITGVSPNPAAGSNSPQPLTITGSGFVAGCTVTLRGVSFSGTYPNISTSFISSTQVSISVTLGTDPSTWSAQVINPSGASSNQYNFSVNAPFPVITTLSPSSKTAGDSAFTLTVNGSNFTSLSDVQWKGSNRTTTFVSSTQLTASITAGDIATAGSATVTVFNPLPGGGTSGGSTFAINNPAPSAPTLASPSNGATGIATNPTLGWNASSGATSYHLQVSTNSSFTTLVYDQSGITGTSQQVSGLANNTLYFWRVNATNAGGTSDWSSFWNFTTTGPSSVERFNSEIPTTYHLAQNYPNPFNPLTTIQFSLPKESPVVLTIFNSRGMEIEVLVNQNLPAGHYRTQWAPRNTPSGVYFYQLKSTEFTNTKKLLLLR